MLVTKYFILSKIEKFVHEQNAEIFVMCDTTSEVLNLLKAYKAPSTRYGLDWTKKDEEKMKSLV